MIYISLSPSLYYLVTWLTSPYSYPLLLLFRAFLKPVPFSLPYTGIKSSAHPVRVQLLSSHFPCIHRPRPTPCSLHLSTPGGLVQGIRRLAQHLHPQLSPDS